MERMQVTTPIQTLGMIENTWAVLFACSRTAPVLGPLYLQRPAETKDEGHLQQEKLFVRTLEMIPILESFLNPIQWPVTEYLL